MNSKFSLIIDFDSTIINLETSIGNIKLDSPFINASGCYCTSHNDLEELNASSSGAFITKTMTNMPREGNPELKRLDLFEFPMICVLSVYHCF